MGRRHQDSRAKQEVIAIVDIGSTAVRFLLARVTPGASYRVLVEERVPTRLGGGAPGTLPREAIEETLKAVHRFFSKYSPTAWGPRVVAVATSAVRGARNPEQLLGPLRRKEGIDVQVLSARDEAKLGVDAALDSLPFKDGVVADLGRASEPQSRPSANGWTPCRSGSARRSAGSTPSGPTSSWRAPSSSRRPWSSVAICG